MTKIERTVLLQALLLMLGCSRSGEPATRKLPPGVGPGAIGSRAKLDPIIAERCPVKYVHRFPREFKPFQEEGKPGSRDPEGRPKGPSQDIWFVCGDVARVLDDVQITVIYQEVDGAPPEWRDPVYELYFDGVGDKVLAAAKLWAGPFMTEPGLRELDYIAAHYRDDQIYYPRIFSLGHNLWIRPNGKLRGSDHAVIKIGGQHAGIEIVEFPR